MFEYNHLYGIDIDSEMTHIDIFFSKIESVEEGSNIQRGLHDSEGETLVSIIGRGAFAFDFESKKVYPSYFAEKLNISVTEAEKIFQTFNIQYV